jgi:hypothetical protein
MKMSDENKNRVMVVEETVTVTPVNDINFEEAINELINFKIITLICKNYTKNS